MTDIPKKGLIESVLELLAASIGSIKDGTVDTAMGYGQFLKRWTLLFLVVTTTLALLSALGYALGSAGLFSIGLTLVGFSVAIWILAFTPVLVLLAIAEEKIPPLNRVISGVLLALFLVVSLGVYLYLLFPYLEPRLTFLLILFIGTMAVFQVYFGVDPNLLKILKTRLTVGSIVLAMGLIPAFALWPWVWPKLPPGFGTVPKRIILSSPQAFESQDFFNRGTGDPEVWYSRDRDGLYEIFDNEGFHPIRREKLLPVTPDVVAEIGRQVQDEWNRREPDPPKDPTPEPPPVIPPAEPGGEGTQPKEPVISLDPTPSPQAIVEAVGFCVTGNQSGAEGPIRSAAARVLGQRTKVVPIEDCSESISLEATRYRYGIVRIEFDLSSSENPSHPGFFAAVVRCDVEHHREGLIVAAQSLTAQAPSGSKGGAEGKALTDLSTELASVLTLWEINE